MPPLQRYDLPGVTPKTKDFAAVGQQAIAQTHQSLAQKLEGWSQYAFKEAAAKRQAEGKKQALIDVSETGEYIPRGDYTIYDKAYNEVGSATYAANAELDISAKSQEYAIQFQSDPDGYNKAMDEYISDYTKNSPTPELNAVVKTAGRRTAQNMFGKLLIAEDAAVRDNQVTTFKQSWDLNLGQIVDLEAQGNVEQAEILKAKNLDHLTRMMEEGLISPADGEKLMEEGEYKITLNTALENMKLLLDDADLTNASKYLKAVNKENRADLTIEQNDKLQAELNRMYSNEVKARKAEAKNGQDFSNQILGDAIDILKAGKTPDNLAEVRSAYAGASKAKKWEFDTQVKAAKIYNKHFINIPLTEMEDALNIYESKKKISATDLEVMNTLRRNLKQKTVAVKNDVVGEAVRDGIIQPTIGMSAADGIDGLLSGLSEMKANTNLIKEHYGDHKVELLSKADAQSWADYLSDPYVAVGDKLEVIANVNDMYPELSKQVFDQIGGKNAGSFALAADLAINGNEKAAKLMLTGKGAEVELDEGIKQEIKTKLGNVFGGTDSAEFNKNYNGLLDYAKGMSLNNEVIDADDTIETSIGQIKRYNNKNTIIPYGVQKREFEAWLDEIEIPGRPALQEGLRDMTDVFGSGDYQLHYAGQGQYFIVNDNNGNPYYVPDTEDPTKRMILKWGD